MFFHTKMEDGRHINVIVAWIVLLKPCLNELVVVSICTKFCEYGLLLATKHFLLLVILITIFGVNDQ